MVLGVKYNEKITAGGELRQFSDTREIITIPAEVYSIAEGAIELHEDNKVLILGNNIQDIHPKGIAGDWNLAEIVIYCNESVNTKILKALKSTNYKILFKNNVSMQDYLEALELPSGITVRATNKTTQFVDKVANELIKQLGNTSVIYKDYKRMDAETKSEIRDILKRYNKFYMAWHKIADQVSSGINIRTSKNLDQLTARVELYREDRRLKY